MIDNNVAGRTNAALLSSHIFQVKLAERNMKSFGESARDSNDYFSKKATNTTTMITTITTQIDEKTQKRNNNLYNLIWACSSNQWSVC